MWGQIQLIQKSYIQSKVKEGCFLQNQTDPLIQEWKEKRRLFNRFNLNVAIILFMPSK